MTEDAREPAASPFALEHALGWIGGTAMFASVTIDCCVVIARQFRISLPGSTEVIQFAIVPATAVAIVASTRLRAHAEVHLLLERMGPHVRARMARVGSAALTLFFLLLGTAMTWLLAETIGEPERSDLLGLPILPLRMVAVLAVLVSAAIAVRRVFRPAEQNAADAT